MFNLFLPPPHADCPKTAAKMMPTATKGKRPLRHLTATDKCIAIQRIHDGESKASVARDIGVPESTLRGWCKNEEKLRYMSQQAQDQKPNSDNLMDKIVSEAAMAAAAAAELLGGGPAEKRAKLDPAFLAMNGGKGLKGDYHNMYKRNSLNGMDLGGGHHHSSAADAYAYSYNSFAKAASNLSAMQNKQKDIKGYDLSLKADDHGKSDLSMAAISPLTSLSNLSGMGALGQSPLALSFNDIATNLNLLAQLQSNSMASYGNSPGGGNVGAPMRSSRPRSNPNNHNNNSSCSPRSDMDKHGVNGPQSLTVKNLAKLQQRSPSLSANDMGLSDTNNNNSHLMLGNKSMSNKASKVNGGANNPTEDPLWYWLKSQQAMMGLNGLYSQLPRTSSPVAPTVRNSAAPPQASPTTPNAMNHATSTTISTPQNSGQSKATVASANNQSNANFDYHLLNAMLPNSLAGLSDPKALTSSPFFWQWYKTIGANLLKGNASQPQQPAASPSQKNNHLPVDANLNYLSPTGSHKSGGSSSPYNNILFLQLTKSAANHQSGDAAKSEPEDLSHHHQNLLQHHLDQQQHRRDAMAQQLFHDDEEDGEEVSRPLSSHSIGATLRLDEAEEPQRRRHNTGEDTQQNASDLSGTTNNTASSGARNGNVHSRTPSPSTVKCSTATNVLELMNPDASPLNNSLLKPISGAGSDVAMPMSHSSTHSSSTNSTTMLTEAPNSPQSGHGEGEGDEELDDTSNDSLHHLQQQPNKSPGKVRAVLDNFLYNNINNTQNPEEGIRTQANGENVENEHNNNIDIRNNNNVPLMNSLEAFEYGEKFLKWLESCSDPSITAMQVMQFRYLLQSVKTSANRAANNNNNTMTTISGPLDNTTGGGYTHHHGGSAVEFMAVKREVVGMAEERSKIRRRK